MKTLLLILFFLGVIMTILGFYMNKEKQKTKIEYRFIDQTLEESQKGDQVSLINLYKPMFEDASIIT